jgi:hypothetical protein
MLSPRPSAVAAPSIWYDEVADPHKKSLGNRRPASMVEALSEYGLKTVTIETPKIR